MSSNPRAGSRLPGVIVESWSLAAQAAEVERLLLLLSPDEHARASALVRADVRRRFVVARARLRVRLARELSAAPEGLVFRYGPSGKPALEADTALHFNLAHSGELAVLAIGDTPVGVDVEAVRPRASAPDLAERWFHPDERARIAASADPLAEFYRVWVMKEAALKLVGLGVGEALPRLLTPAGTGLATGLPPNELGIAECWVRTMPVAPLFAAALATPP